MSLDRFKRRNLKDKIRDLEGKEAEEVEEVLEEEEILDEPALPAKGRGRKKAK